MTKAIVVFGGADEAAEAKKSVKASHNLKVGQKYFFEAAIYVTLRHLERQGKRHERELYTNHLLLHLQQELSYPSLSQLTG